MKVLTWHAQAPLHRLTGQQVETQEIYCASGGGRTWVINGRELGGDELQKPGPAQSSDLRAREGTSRGSQRLLACAFSHGEAAVSLSWAEGRSGYVQPANPLARKRQDANGDAGMEGRQQLPAW
jgi:hypothetical protein